MKSYSELREAITSYSFNCEFSFHEVEEDYNPFERKEGFPKNYLLTPGMVIVSLRRVIRGASGGNCWGDEAREFEGEYDFSDRGIEQIFDFLEVKASPDLVNLGILEKVKICTVQDSVYEYYGNYEEIEEIFVNLEELYHHICNMPIYFKFPPCEPTYLRHGLHFVKWHDGTKGHAIWNGKGYECGRVPAEYSPIPEPQ